MTDPRDSDLATPAAADSHPHEDAIPVPRPRRKGIYILPNAVTLAALFSGFYGIVMGAINLAMNMIYVAPLTAQQAQAPAQDFGGGAVVDVQP